MGHPVVHWELWSKDPAGIADFYERVFGWKVLEAHGTKIQEAGGKVVVRRTEVAGMGAFALFEDPDGRVVGIWEQASAAGTGQS